jgi:arylsulfatase A-like enzyme
LITDGTTHTYRLALSSPRMRSWDGPWTHLGIWFTSDEGVDTATLEILSVRVVPAEAEFATERAGVLMVGRGAGEQAVLEAPHRRTLYMHAPGAIEYRIAIPEAGRLDFGLGVLRSDRPVAFAVSAEHPSGETETLFEETYSDGRRWGQRTIDLSRLAGLTVRLTLRCRAEQPGTVALWAAPTLSGTRVSDAPNVILYIIDGGGADYMSVYGYDRETTPNLERISDEGAVFERAYSNSSWTRPSTVSLLTSLQHSVLGGMRNGRNPVPVEVLTLAEHLHRAGYQTAQFTSNPNAGSMSDLDRGLDFFREAGVQPSSISTVELHENFRRWRAAYPGEPYYVHIQSTDVHNDHTPVEPFAGRFIDEQRRALSTQWLERVNKIPETDDAGIIDAVDRIGVSQTEFWSAQHDLHDETMLHQDHRLGELVNRLKESGEWLRTVLIIAADHSVAAGSWDYRLLRRDPQPEHVYHDDPVVPMHRPGVSRIPLIVVWPGHIAADQRLTQAVSLIDLLPTILDLADLPMPEVMMGQSLAPVLLGRPERWEPLPVIFDEFEVDDDSGELRGRIEVVDGRWGASLQINPDPETRADRARPARLLLCDLENDPHCLVSVHDEHPDRVEKYTAFLEARLDAHRALAQRFSRSGEESVMTPEQLETLRSLGYVQ